MFEALNRFLSVRREGDNDNRKEASPAQEREAADSQTIAVRHLELYQEAMGCIARGESDAAIRKLEEALELRHDFAEAHVSLGQIYHARGQLDDASDCYALATHFRDDLPIAHLQRGLLALDRGKFSEAQCHLERAIALKPDDAVAHNALGAALLKLSQVDAAAASFRRALALKSDLAKAHSNLGYLLFRELEQFAAGARHIEIALALAPGDESVLCNWTMLLQQQGRFDEVLALSERLLSVDPGLHEVRVNRALVQLTRGEFASGWENYEARKLMPPYSRIARPWPEWDGGPLAGKTLLVYAEQGVGDEIMFASCLPDVIRAATHCTVECSPKLEPLFRRSFPSARIFAKHGPGLAAGGGWLGERVDCQAAAGSLPRYLRRAHADFPRHTGYLVADPARVMHWKSRLAQLGPGVKVGISWRGGVESTRRSLRSIPLEHWPPILSCADAHFVSLQYTDARAELADLRARHGIEVQLWQDAIDDFDETAALVSALDLVVTVQTTVAHLSGALGRAAWVMIPRIPEWRYLERGETMPWYPAVRLHRQAVAGDWRDVMQTVAANLSRRAHVGPKQ